MENIVTRKLKMRYLKFQLLAIIGNGERRNLMHDSELTPKQGGDIICAYLKISSFNLAIVSGSNNQ